MSEHQQGEVPGGVAVPLPGASPPFDSLGIPEVIVIKPVLFGYIRAEIGAPQAHDPQVGRLRAQLLRFAVREGFALAHVFVETRATSPWAALMSLLEASRFTSIAAVLIPDIAHLGDNATEQATTRAHIQEVIGGPVIALKLDADTARVPARP